MKRILFFAVALFCVTACQNREWPAIVLPENEQCFDDPVTNGAADPVLIWNHKSNQWVMYYTQRRANMPNPQGVDWAHGCSIGIATSPDGSEWTYYGVCQDDKMLSNTDPEKRHTWWAPDVFTDEKGLFHMFVTYVPNITTDWSGPRDIRHYTSEDGFNWDFQSVLPLEAERCIDPCVKKIGDTWYLWYKNESVGGYTWMAKSPDLYTWEVVGEMTKDVAHEAPYVWEWDGKYWMIVDAWSHYRRIYVSEDGLSGWEFSSEISSFAHPAVYIIQGKPIITGHLHIDGRHSVLLMHELQYADGKFSVKE
ncbi:MAG: lipoprotein [Alistipes sp.]|nr:lipoprotein [Alistipes sp.]